MSDFLSLGLDPALADILSERGIQAPTPIQKEAIPLALDGSDVMGLAQTGTGKTLAFGLPLIQQLLQNPGRPKPKTVKALILAPTRELVNQIAQNLKPLAEGSPLRVNLVVGGQPIARQINNLSRGTDILVATPGRLIDLMDRKGVDLSTVRFLVLDEADQMLDMGFIHALRKIAPQLGKPRQTMLFSATMSREMEELSSSYLDKPFKVEVTPPGKTADKVDQSVIFLEEDDKLNALRKILEDDPQALSIIFMRTKHHAERLMKQLVKDGFLAASIHGNKSQNQRDKAIKDFKAAEINILVATDVAARGIDIPGVSYVINYALPNVSESYVHRIGRTARAGRDGQAISLCSPEESSYLRDIEKLIGRSFDIPPGFGKPPIKQQPRGRGRGQGGGQGGGGRGGDRAKQDAKGPSQRSRPAGNRGPAKHKTVGKPAGSPSSKAGGARRPRRPSPA